MFRIITHTFVIAVALSSFATHVKAERDPFMPTILNIFTPSNETKEVKKNDALEGLSSPLKTQSINSMRLIGTILSEKISLATLKTNENINYFVKVGDIVGKEKAEIKRISHGGIEVIVKDKNIYLPVQNRLEVLNSETN